MRNMSTLTERVTKCGCASRKLLVVAMLLLGFLPEVYSQQRPQQKFPANTDSIFIFSFRPQGRMFETRLNSNSLLLKELGNSLHSFRKGIDTLYVAGYSGALGNERADRGTAFWRCINLKGYLINTKQLQESDFKTRNYPFAHEKWGEVVLLSFSPFASSSFLPIEKEDTLAVIAETAQKETLQKETLQEETTQTLPAASSMISEEQEITVQPLPVERYLSLKTNLAAWAGTIMNVSADIQTGKHLSLELPLLWCPWHISDQHSVRIFTFQPELRYWLSKPGQGHFFGLHAHVGWFNAKWNDRRYQDVDRPLLGAGISYGYLLPLNDRWAAEFTLGAGYANLKYDTYYNIANGVRLDTQTKNYWGITRVALSLVYRFNTTK